MIAWQARHGKARHGRYGRGDVMQYKDGVKYRLRVGKMQISFTLDGFNAVETKLQDGIAKAKYQAYQQQQKQKQIA